VSQTRESVAFAGGSLLGRAQRRIIGLIVLLACLAPLVAAASVVPDASGYGTHRQLGMPACGFLLATGGPCPTCGMTTSFAHAVRGNLLRAAFVQPGGLLLCLLAACGVWIGLHTLVFDSRAVEVAFGALTTRTILAILGVLLLAYIYKLTTWN